MAKTSRPNPWPMQPTYPLHWPTNGVCQGCKRPNEVLFRVYGPQVFRYRCDQCIKKGMVR